MTHRRKILGAIGLTALFVAPSAFAQTTTDDTFTVQITIEESCAIDTAATDMDFGTVGILNNDTATSTVNVTCSNGTPYDIGLDAGVGAGASVASRFMTGSGAETVEYALYQDAAHSTLWGETIGADTQTGTGNGAPQPYTVYGQLATQTTPTADTYTDTITLTVTY
ncbi:spore coat U domain-containing protein [Sphingopyxis sp. JAI128]|uniref:Csu type fimbrial protein n=1 Tax=Sphingopyxis sp. JAI128 TaxID=2723066 RepID=UPI0018557B8B|nr:spore coat U domain-containing protein [Sphingopyxis sp. JAI128]MBB6428172.1 spore coat protein U-like protein [Sphingopyxis sp. JAI128]